MKSWVLSCLTLLVSTSAAHAQRAEPEAWLGRWRIVLSQAIAGSEDARAAADPVLGTALRLHADGIEAAPPIGCDHARMHSFVLPAEGLFQGSLSSPQTDAERLGLALPATTLRIDCSSGSWDLHAADDQTLLFALDQHIYTLSRSVGALAPSGSPEHAVQSLLEAHFAGRMGFDEAHWSGLEAWLSAGLRDSIAAYRTAPWPVDEVPPINGDPLTDSQEYPTRFAVGSALVEGDRAMLEVAFADAYVRRRLRYLLVREGARWQVDDVVGEDGSRLSTLLAQRP